MLIKERKNIFTVRMYPEYRNMGEFTGTQDKNIFKV